MKEIWQTLSPWKKFKLILTLLLVSGIVIFAIINWKDIEIEFIFFNLTISETLLIFISLLVGYLSSSLFDIRKSMRKSRELTELKSKIEELELLLAKREA